MSLEHLYASWRDRFGQGWGLAWLLGATLAERYGPRCGVVLVPLHQEGVGWYGLVAQVPQPGGPAEDIGRITASGDVERWGDDGTDRLELDDAPVAAWTGMAAKHLGLDRLPRYGDPHAVDAAVTVGILARVALQVGTGTFAVLPVQAEHSGPGLLSLLALHGPSAQVTICTVPENRGEGVDLVGRHLRGESADDLAVELSERLGLRVPLSAQDDDYTLAEHRHRYAAWCAARAAGRKLPGATNRAVRVALEASGLPGLVSGPVERWPTSEPVFDRMHLRWCAEIVGALHAQGVEEVTFGRAAKIVAVYLKTLVVCGGHHLRPLAEVAHPPIDRVLLQSLARDRRFPPDVRRMWRETSWTGLTVDGYDDIIQSLREAGLDLGGFWRVERWWRGDSG